MKTPYGETLTVNDAENGLSLLDFLAQRLALSRRRTKTLLDERNVFVNGHRTWMARHTLKAGDAVQVTIARPPANTDDAVRVLYRDDAMLVVDKPCGRIAVGPYGLETTLRKPLACPSLCAVHRLDRDTTGCLLFAMNPAIKALLAEQFRQRTVRKIYDALVFGRAAFSRRTIRLPLDGRSAITHARTLQTGAGVSHLEVCIETGRTHQIRRHLAAIGHALVGDKYYGAGTACPPSMRDVARQMLHARLLRLHHPHTNTAITIDAPLPKDFNACLLRSLHE